MRKLKTYKLFESLKSNGDYITLAHLLYDLFDHWGVLEWTDETFDSTTFPNGIEDDGYPTHKFWAFRLDGSKSSFKCQNSDGFVRQNQLSVQTKKLGADEVGAKELLIYNIKKDEMVEFYHDLEVVISEAKDAIGKDISIEEEVYGGDIGYTDYVDYIIRIK
jgi:hypothetical protein